LKLPQVNFPILEKLVWIFFIFRQQ
jgi:hypothetical protein